MTRPLFRFLDAGDAIRRRNERGDAIEPTHVAIRRSLIDEALLRHGGHPGRAAKAIGESVEYVEAHCREHERMKGKLTVIDGGAA